MFENTCYFILYINIFFLSFFLRFFKNLIEKIKRNVLLKKDNKIMNEINLDDVYINLSDLEFSTNEYSNAKIYEKSILNDMKNIPFPEEIKKKANAIFLEMKIPTKKKGKRKQLIYHCITSAYKEFEIPFIPNLVATHVGISIRDASKSRSLYSRVITGYNVRGKRFDPIDYIPVLYGYMGIKEGHEETLKLITNIIIKKDSRILNSTPHIITAGIILYFFEIIGMEYNGNLEKILGIYRTKLYDTKKKIKEIYNE